MKKDYRMYILVNEDIKISKGKLAGQVGHAVSTYLYKTIIEEFRQNYLGWLQDEMVDDSLEELDEYMKEQKKIILKCPQWKLEELERGSRFPVSIIRDKGYTQLDPNALTCANIGIWDVNEVPDWINSLKLV
jgi:PTH2 family peptidyl-tRNA hydrolase